MGGVWLLVNPVLDLLKAALKPQHSVDKYSRLSEEIATCDGRTAVMVKRKCTVYAMFMILIINGPYD